MDAWYYNRVWNPNIRPASYHITRTFQTSFSDSALCKRSCTSGLSSDILSRGNIVGRVVVPFRHSPIFIDYTRVNAYALILFRSQPSCAPRTRFQDPIQPTQTPPWTPCQHASYQTSVAVRLRLVGLCKLNLGWELKILGNFMVIRKWLLLPQRWHEDINKSLQLPHFTLFGAFDTAFQL